MKYKIIRPPLISTYELPSRQDLLELRPGDVAKLIFQVGDDKPERIWVTIKDCTKPDEWTGAVDNDAAQPLTVKTLPAGELVAFHPLDIVAIE